MRRFRDISSAVITDMGGLSHCSEAKRQLVRRFAACAVLAEAAEAELANGGKLDVAEHCLLTSSMVRISTRIGLGRHAKTVPSLAEYLAATDSAAREREAKHIATIEDEDNE